MGLSDSSKSKEIYRSRLRSGVCVRCQGIPISGRPICRECHDKITSRRVMRIRSYICTRCGRPNKRGKKSCIDCYLLTAGKRQYRKENGLCVSTGCSNRQSPGRVNCDQCILNIDIEKAERRDCGLCESRGCYNDRRPGKAKCSECANYGVERARRTKQLVLDHYGQKCNCLCGCTVTNFNWLTVDHKNNDGAKRRREGANGYGWIIKAAFPNDLQVLCFNCNCAKEFYGDCDDKAK